ncbi:hypothetical protein EXIGLDRAFT_717357 [Exidia glandulosa HHB12029]|uniref:Uncharacterized protein n=1 Tax=Exidia glandulosa HHB12029 TaxID=1314781 RepID=A0A165IGT5_EXIGL|nr:hypothetical protein EXIGLDRAFT_717357 [Exidia glandulosa HHB12029]
MCHRQRFYTRHARCGHLSYIAGGDVKVDCNSATCAHSAAHPANCPNCPQRLCTQWMRQAERIVRNTLPNLCPDCTANAAQGTGSA